MEEIEGRRGEGRESVLCARKKKKSRHLCYSVSRPVFPTNVSCKTDKPIEMPTAHGQLFGALVTSSVVQMYSQTFELNAVKEDVDLVLLLLTSLSGKVLQSIMSVRPSVSSV